MIAATFFAATAWAQTVSQAQSEKGFFTNKCNKNQRKTDLTFMLTNVLKNHPTSKPSQQPPVTEQPEGSIINNLYRSTSESYFVGWGSVFSTPIDGFVGTLAKDNNGNIYMEAPFAALNTGTWLKLDKTESDTLVAKGNQPIYQVDYQGEQIDFYVSRMVTNQTAEGDLTYVIDKQNPDIKFVYRNDSLIQVSDGIIGMHTVDGKWAEFGDLNSVFSTVKDKVADINPSLQYNDCYMKFLTSDSQDGQLVKLAFDNEDVYIRGAFPNMPEATIIGKKEGNKVVFESNQYLGIDNVPKNHAYFFGGTSQKTVDKDGYQQEELFHTKNLTFDFDADKMSLVADSAMCFNGGNRIMSYIHFFRQPEINTYTETATTPAMPKIILFYEFNPDEGYATLMFDYSKFDEQGQFMNPEKLYYKIYKDNEVLTFLPEDYPGLTAPTNEMSYNYDDRQSVLVTETYHYIQIYEDGYSKIGVSCIYKGGGETHESPITWKIIGEDTSVKNFHTDQIAVSRYLDISGRRVVNPSQGLFIKEDILTNGTRKYTKVLIK